MKALHLTVQPDGRFESAPLPLPMRQRQGKEDVAHYRRQAAGTEPIGNFGPQASNVLRTICLSDGPFADIATQAGALLTFIIAGELSFVDSDGVTVRLEPGDAIRTDDSGAAPLLFHASHQARLLQIDVASDWPGEGAEIQESGTISPRKDGALNFKRMYTGDDEKAYFADFSEIFSNVADEWTAARPIEGFRMSCWANGRLDYHPGVVNQIGLVMSGVLELEVSGDGSTEFFYAGDMCLSQDRTGVGHRNTKHGISHTVQIVLADEHLWPFDPSGVAKVFSDWL